MTHCHIVVFSHGVIFLFVTVVPYRVLIFPSLKFGCSTTSANPWINFAGHMGETGIIEIPKGVLEFSVEVRTKPCGLCQSKSTSFNSLHAG